MASTFGAVQLAHEFLSAHVKQGDFCIDCTAGRGNDTLFLCQLVGKNGRVVSMDIQNEAIGATEKLIKEKGFESICRVVKDSHANVDRYAQENEISAIVFNFGWLPGGNHNIYTQTESSIEAIEKCLKLLKVGGIMSLSVYYGRETGFEEKEAILKYVSSLPVWKFTVLVSEFSNRPNCPPISIRIYRDN